MRRSARAPTDTIPNGAAAGTKVVTKRPGFDVAVASAWNVVMPRDRNTAISSWIATPEIIPGTEGPSVPANIGTPARMSFRVASSYDARCATTDPFCV